MLAFKFTAYRTSIKIYIEARMLPQQSQIMFTGNENRFAYFINKNKQLILELSERLAIKYMCQCDNEFSQLIETFLIVANN